MKKERMKILEMVEEGKISVEDAAKLFEALKADNEFGWGSADFESAEEKLNQFSRNVDSFAKEFSDKFSGAFKEVEPKLKSATKVVLEKTVSLIDDVSRSLHEAAKNMEAEASEEAVFEEAAPEEAAPEEAAPEASEPHEN